MNKKIIAFALVLLIVMGGVFALPNYTPATALLQSTIGDSFSHGFLIGDSTAYQTGVTVSDNAFSVDPELKYGFTAKHSSAFKAQLSVTAFTKTGSGIVNIDTVTVGNENPAQWTDSSTKFNLLVYEGTDVNKTVKKDVKIVITPKAIDDNTPVGTYTATVTVSLVTVS